MRIWVAGAVLIGTPIFVETLMDITTGSHHMLAICGLDSSFRLYWCCLELWCRSSVVGWARKTESSSWNTCSKHWLRASKGIRVLVPPHSRNEIIEKDINNEI
jgi:hypothetical protein